MSGLSSASSSGALSGTPTNVTLSVAHNDDNMNANAPIVAANSTICTTMRAETTQPSLATEVEVIFSTSNNTAGAMVANPPRAVRRIREIKCGPSIPRSIRSPRPTAASRSARIPAEASIRDIVSHTPASLMALRCARVPKSLPKMPKASMPTSAVNPTATPNQGRSRSAGWTYLMIGWSGRCELFWVTLPSYKDGSLNAVGWTGNGALGTEPAGRSSVYGARLCAGLLFGQRVVRRLDAGHVPLARRDPEHQGDHREDYGRPPDLLGPEDVGDDPEKGPEGGHGDRVGVAGVPRDAHGEDRAEEAHEYAEHRRGPPEERAGALERLGPFAYL